MTLALLSTAQHVSDVNTSIFRSLRLLVALCRLTWGVLVLCSGIVCWWCGILKMDVLTSETCWAVDNKASVIYLANLYPIITKMCLYLRIQALTKGKLRLVVQWTDTPSPYFTLQFLLRPFCIKTICALLFSCVTPFGCFRSLSLASSYSIISYANVFDLHQPFFL